MTARYGTSPLHLVAHIALFLVFAVVVSFLWDAREPLNVAMWFVGAIVLHDLVLLPFYSTLDRLADRAAPRGAVNYLRIPTALSALMLLLFFPAILGRNEGSFARVAGVEPSGHLERWLFVSALLFVGSLLLYVIKVTVRRRQQA